MLRAALHIIRYTEKKRGTLYHLLCKILVGGAPLRSAHHAGCATSRASWEQLDIIIREMWSSSDKSAEFTAAAIRGRHYVQA